MYKFRNIDTYDWFYGPGSLITFFKSDTKDSLKE